MPLWKIMISSENKFDGTFMKDYLVVFVPKDLLILVSVLIDGSIGQPLLIVFQFFL